LVVASALTPFSPEQISVIAQNQQRLFRDVVGHRSKQSILKAIQVGRCAGAAYYRNDSVYRKAN